MILVAWIFLIFFGLIALQNTFKYFFGDGMSAPQAVLWIFSAIVSGISAGVIWGGLFNNI
jgi:hypothetical protein